MVSDMPCPKALSSRLTLIVVFQTGLAPWFLSAGDGTLTLGSIHATAYALLVLTFLSPEADCSNTSSFRASFILSLPLSLLFFPSYFRRSLAQVSVGYKPGAEFSTNANTAQKLLNPALTSCFSHLKNSAAKRRGNTKGRGRQEDANPCQISRNGDLEKNFLLDNALRILTESFHL
jgi:hypothetical protein